MRLGEIYPIPPLASMKIATDALEAARKITEFHAPMAGFAATLATIRSTALDMKASIGPFPPISKRCVCERCEAKDARIAELEAERTELIEMIPVVEEPSGA